MADKKAKCWNCKHASSRFKIADTTHYNCLHPKHEEGLKSGELSPWDMLNSWYDTCESHETKNNIITLDGDSKRK